MRTLFAIIVLFAFVGCGGRSSAPALPPESAKQAPLATFITISDTLTTAPSDTLQLGRMRSGEIVAQSVGVINNSSSPLVITRTESSCGCTNIDYPQQPTLAGDTLRATIEFDSHGFYGWQFKRVQLYTSAAVFPITIYIESEVE